MSFDLMVLVRWQIGVYRKYRIKSLVYVASFQIITSVNVDSRRRYYGLRFDAAISRPFAANEAHAAAVASKRMP